MPSTREQQRAQKAYEAVIAVHRGSWSQERKDDYGRQCKQLPALIHECGVCQALTFLEAKWSEKKPYFRQVLDDLAAAMGEESGVRLLAKARTAETAEYHLLGRHALRCAEWLKRYAEAVLKVDEPGTEDEEEE